MLPLIATMVRIQNSQLPEFLKDITTNAFEFTEEAKAAASFLLVSETEQEHKKNVLKFDYSQFSLLLYRALIQHILEYFIR